MKDFTILTLGQLLAHESTTIRRLAGSILKLMQRATLPESNTCKDCKNTIPSGQACQLYCKQCIPNHK